MLRGHKIIVMGVDEQDAASSMSRRRRTSSAHVAVFGAFGTRTPCGSPADRWEDDSRL